MTIYQNKHIRTIISNLDLILKVLIPFLRDALLPNFFYWKADNSAKSFETTTSIVIDLSILCSFVMCLACEREEVWPI